MTLEKTLLKTIEEYESLLKFEKASPDSILSIHQKMLPLGNKIDCIEGNPSLIKEYAIPHPNSKLIRNEHSTSVINTANPNGKIEIQYIWENHFIKGIYLYAHDFFFPRADENGEWWHSREGYCSDFGCNETEFGYMHVLRTEGKGSFWSSEAMKLDPKNAPEFSAERLRINQEKDARKIKLRLFNTQLKDEAIKAITISKTSLEKGDLTAFFNHINYKLLDGLYQNED